MNENKNLAIILDDLRSVEYHKVFKSLKTLQNSGVTDKEKTANIALDLYLDRDYWKRLKAKMIQSGEYNADLNDENALNLNVLYDDLREVTIIPFLILMNVGFHSNAMRSIYSVRRVN